ncbi:MAG: MGMT family protein [bacterium]|nr:MGMT family protein [bacterium]
MNFLERVYEEAGKIPKGKVLTYGQIASLISTPRAARIVGFALRQLPPDTKIPWQRVVNGRGMISIENMNFPKTEQARRLQGEGIEVVLRDGNYWVDLKKYLWNARD